MGAIGYVAWQSDQMARSLERMGAVQEETSKTVKDLMARTTAENAGARQEVGMPDVQQWLKAIEKPLADKAIEVAQIAQRSQWESSLKEWAERMRRQDEQQWQNLSAALARERQEDLKRDQAGEKRSQEAAKRYVEEQKRWQDLVASLQAEQAGAKESYQRQEKQWSQILSSLQVHGEKVEQQFREVVQKLREEKAEALARTKELEEERQREIGKLLDQANQISQERKRQLSEFCAKRPESVICRDL